MIYNSLHPHFFINYYHQNGFPLIWYMVYCFFFSITYFLMLPLQLHFSITSELLFLFLFIAIIILVQVMFFTGFCAMCVHYDFYDISMQQNQRNIIGAGQNRRMSKSAHVKIGACQNLRRSESAQKKNETTWLYLALIKKNSCVKFIVLRLTVTRYIGNMIVFLHCH